jgi:hypothetical protein
MNTRGTDFHVVRSAIGEAVGVSTWWRLGAVVLGLVALLLMSAAFGAAGWHFREPPDYECLVHVPSEWDERTHIEGQRRWWPPGTECTYRWPPTGEVRHWETGWRPVVFGAGALATGAAALLLVVGRLVRR